MQLLCRLQSCVRFIISTFLPIFPFLFSNRSEREVRGAGLVLQTVWGYKDLRRTLEKDGWKKTDFMVNLNPPSNRTNGGYEESTHLLPDKGQCRRVSEERRLSVLVCGSKCPL